MESPQHKIHVVHVIANQPFVPYLNWFAERVHNYPGVKFTMVSLYPEKPRMMDDMRIRNCDCYWIKYDKRYKKTWMVYAFFKLFFLFRKLKPDVVHTHLFDDSLVGLFAARLSDVKKRVVLKQVTAYNWYYNKFWVWGDILNNINATDIVAISEESKKFLLEKEKASSRKISLIYNGVPIEQYSAQSDEQKQHFVNEYGLKDRIVIGTVARYVKFKGHQYIIEAAKTLVKKYPAIKFLFIGHGGKLETARLKELVKQNNLEEHIIFTGFIQPDFMPSLYGVMDICLHAAFMEPFGLVYIEAMLNRVPIVTSETGIAAEILKHKYTCYFTKYEDPDGIIEGVSWMLENPTEREAMKDRIKKIATENFSIERKLDNYIKLYKGIK